MLIPWSPRLELGIYAIDIQHKDLINKVNDLYTIIRCKRPQSEINNLIYEFHELSNYHFNFEYKLLNKYEYPDLDKRSVSINRYDKKLNDLYYRHEEFLGNLKILNYIKNEVINHILHEDREYLNFLSGVKDFDYNISTVSIDVMKTT